MRETLSPGVYVQAVPPSAPLITGVATSTAGFVGVAHDVHMPARPGEFRRHDNGDLILDRAGNPVPIRYALAQAGVPKRVASWGAFTSLFGEIQAGNTYLAHAVYGFFKNGGTTCWVLRVDGASLPADLGPVLGAFEAVDDVAIVAVPGADQAAQHEAIVAHCAGMQDRIAILDAAMTDDAGRRAVAAVGSRTGASYAALYYPWIKVFDPVTGALETVPPSGHVAGVFARSDATQGVFKAPANEAVEGALGVTRSFGAVARYELNAIGVNVLRSINGEIRIWGARTMADMATTAFPFISNRRYFNFLRESIDESTQFVAFEPNSPALWQRVRRAVTAFLRDQWQAGALLGETPDEAFFVKCDEETNPPDLRALGKVVTEIGVAMVRPAEFVVLRMQQETGG